MQLNFLLLLHLLHFPFQLCSTNQGFERKHGSLNINFIDFKAIRVFHTGYLLRTELETFNLSLLPCILGKNFSYDKIRYFKLLLSLKLNKNQTRSLFQSYYYVKINKKNVF